MRLLVILSFISASYAGLLPQSGGYNYQQQNFLTQSLPLPSFQTGGGGGFVQQQNYAQSNPQVLQTPVFAGGASQSYAGSSFGGGYQYSNEVPIVTKDIYVHTAPEEPRDHRPQQVLNVGPPRKHYKIIFIKAPSQQNAANQIRLAQAQTEEKTIVYVLSKKQDAADIQAAIQQAPPLPPSKPEVYFIKYRTKEEAVHAQQQIQAQYDNLGGTTQVSDEGFAPVSSVVGSLGGGGHGGNHQVNNGYLPPAQ